MTDTATVETLTAEVRVLMLGNRQITLSVYRQLDWARPEAVEPFGRVNSGEKSRDTWADPVEFVEVVGRVREGYQRAGSLIRARLNTSRYQHTPANWEKYEGTIREWQSLPLIVLAGLR